MNIRSSVLISGMINIYPWHEHVCLLKLNCIIICTTVFSVFLLTVIVEMSECDKSKEYDLLTMHVLCNRWMEDILLPKKGLIRKTIKQNVRKTLSFEPAGSIC